jgi:FkbM family methyltransferase
VIHCHPLCRSLFEIFGTDLEQKAELNEFIRRCTPSMKLLDVGAHWGFFSLAALHYGRNGTACLAVEASPAAARIIRVNLKLNQATSEVEVIQAAAGARRGVISMLTTGAGGADYFEVPPRGRTDTIDVPQVSISDLCLERGFVPTHLKIDVEGFEEEVLLGAGECIRRHWPTIFLELHGDKIKKRGSNPRSVLVILRELGYACLDLDGIPLTEPIVESRGFNARMVCVREARV